MSWISHGRGRRSGGGKRGGGVLLSGRLLQRWVFQSGLGPVRIVRCPWLRAKSESARSCLARCRESPSSSILGSQFNQNLSLLSQRTLKPAYRSPNQIKLCSSQFSQSITVSVWFCPLHLYLDGKGFHQFIGQFLAISVSDYCTLSQSLNKLPLWKLAEFITCIWDRPILSL